jgi:hypothetical protein
MRRLLLALTVFPAAASAMPGINASVTHGLFGPQIAVRGHYIGMRADARFFALSPTIWSDDSDYENGAKLRSAGAAMDFYPFGGGLRLSAGARYTRNGAVPTAMPTNDSALGSLAYRAMSIGKLVGRGIVKTSSSAMTLGYGGGTERGLAWGLDAGAMVQARMRAAALTSASALSSGPSLDPANAGLPGATGAYRFSPTVQATLGWSF